MSNLPEVTKPIWSTERPPCIGGSEMKEQLDNLIADLVLTSQRVGVAATKSASETYSEIPARDKAEKRLVEYIDAIETDNQFLREKCRIYEEALQSIESPLSNSRARKIAGEALDHFRCGTCGADISE